MSKREIVISTYFAVHRDAVGNDIQIQSSVLRAAGYDVAIYAEHADEYFSSLICSLEEACAILSRPSSILILHHSCYLPSLEELLHAAQGSILVKYHNITPEQYFSHSPRAQKELVLARLQSEIIISSGKVSCYLGDSTYNNEELIQLGAPRQLCRKLAPFHFVEDFHQAGINSKLQASLQDGRFNVLFVGRLMRHKGQIEMIEIIDHYLAMYDHNIRLILVGRLENPGYGHQLEQAINSRRLSSYVEVYQDVDFCDLHTFYKNSQVFLTLSEHEGFGVPILEAQYHHLPVVALDRAAVRETLGDEQLVFEDADPAVFAAALRRVCLDSELRQHLILKGQENYASYSKDLLSEKLCAIVASLP